MSSNANEADGNGVWSGRVIVGTGTLAMTTAPGHRHVTYLHYLQPLYYTHLPT